VDSKLRILLGALLSLLAVSSAILSTIPSFTLESSDHLQLEVDEGITVFEVDYKGLVVAHASLPRGVEVYLLTEPQYRLYRRRGILPGDYLSDDSSLSILNPRWIIVESRVKTSAMIEVEVYAVRRPLRTLSLVSYPLIVASLYLLITGVLMRFEREKELGGLPSEG